MLEGISCKKELFSGGDGALYENITIRRRQGKYSYDF